MRSTPPTLPEVSAAVKKKVKVPRLLRAFRARDFPRVSFADVVLRLLAVIQGSKFRTERARGTLSSSKRLSSSSGSSYKNVCASHVSGASSSSARRSLPHGRPFLLLNLPQEGRKFVLEPSEFLPR